MAVTETEHFLGTALAIQEINQAGGILGRELEVVAYDPGSDPETYRKLADRLLTEDGISVIFGCSTSAARKAILPAIERRNGLLWYPSLYEGFEYSPNVIYTGASTNQNSFPLAEYLIRTYGSRVFLVGSDYVYPRESNRIMRDLITSYGGEIAGEIYVPMDASVADLNAVLNKVKQQGPDVLFSTVVGRTAQSFYRLYREAGFEPNAMTRAYGVDYLIQKLIDLIRELGRFPVWDELELRTRNDRDFPTPTTFSKRFGNKAQLV